MNGWFVVVVVMGVGVRKQHHSLLLNRYIVNLAQCWWLVRSVFITTDAATTTLLFLQQLPHSLADAKKREVLVVVVVLWSIFKVKVEQINKL